MLKESENPPIIFPENTSVKDMTGTWWVAHTKSRNEKALAWQMLKLDIPYFLPMSKKTSKKNGRTTRSVLPLFAGYLFFCGNENQRLEVLKTNRVANLIEVTDQSRFIDDICPIEKLLNNGQQLIPHSFVGAGQKCRVIGGPLAGIEAIVENTSQSMRLVLQVDILGQASSVEISSDMVEAI